jgi:hypothetical protein
MLAWVVAFGSTLRRSRKSSAIRPFRAASFTSSISSHPLAPLYPIFRIFFQVPYLASPLFATLTKTQGVWGYSSHFGTARAGLATGTPYISQVLSFQILAHSFALFCTQKEPNSFLFKRFRTPRQKTPGVGGCSQHCNVQTFNLQTFKRSSRPIAAKRLWCNNRQRHKISLRYGETTPLPPVSKNTRADIGNCSPTFPIKPRFGLGRKSCLGLSF